MALLDGGLKAVFGAAFAAFYLDATLHKSSMSDTGPGGFGVAATDYPAKVMVAALSERARAASGLPEPAVSLSILCAGLSVAPDLGDSVTLSGQRYRLIRIDTDPAGAATLAVALPA